MDLSNDATMYAREVWTDVRYAGHSLRGGRWRPLWRVMRQRALFLAGLSMLLFLEFFPIRPRNWRNAVQAAWERRGYTFNDKS
jgi:hypothetical protein